MNTNASSSRGWSIALGFLLIAAGVLSIVAPYFAGIAASVFFGWLILFGGIAHLVYAWSERGAGAVLWQVLIGLVYSVAGLYMLFMPVGGAAALTLILTFYIALEGVFELSLFGAVRRLPGSSLFLVDGIISLLLAGLIFWHWPSSSFWAIGTLVGVSLVVSGVARLTFPMRPRVLAAAV